MILISWFSFIRVSGVSLERVSCWMHVFIVVKWNQMNNYYKRHCYDVLLKKELNHSAHKRARRKLKTRNSPNTSRSICSSSYLFLFYCPQLLKHTQL
jgi:hypothetical protein